ncbi:dienelactone hydrolase family protein [Geoglobus acetivorans]|uniref:Dienelactone hydrolase family protein n=1 Tax=Geoglobus acetivorans TaxID=565033 RepID=A0ABZ3H8A8_GEOAI|nr:dienelactone hydrolase family protein [Geoglobus acetivorans]
MEIIHGGIRASYREAGNDAVLLCPPHPLMGGNRFDIRLERISEALNEMNISTLSFDYKQPFRMGVGEIEDAKIMLDYLRERHDGVAVLGYSFGSVVASNVAGEAKALILISPLKKINSISLKDSTVPKLIVYAIKDEFVPYSESREIIEMMSEPKKITELDTDHFYTGTMDQLVDSVVEFMKSV